MRADTYQVLLITSGLLVAILFGLFFYREVFPEYKIYQNDYLALEEFRSTYTHQAPPPFQEGVKQIVIEREDRGPATVDRCISCHVALQIPYFSPTRIAHDLNGNQILDADGHPVLVPNEDYIWGKLNEKIGELRDEQVLAQLKKEGKTAEIQVRLNEAQKYESLKTAKVGDLVYDVTKVLAMHPLIGSETRPFEYHPIEEYGCTSCHSGNGRGLTTDKAHGPVFDGNYETENRKEPMFTEPDPENDPLFSRVFNHKPGDSLLFQTEPILVGSLIQSSCIQCHQTSRMRFQGTAQSASDLSQKRQDKLAKLIKDYENQKQAVLDLLNLYRMLEQKGYAQTLQFLKDQQLNQILSEIDLKHLIGQINYLEKTSQGQSEERAKSFAIAKINQDLEIFLGSPSLVENLEKSGLRENVHLDEFLKDHQHDPEAQGTLFVQGEAIDLNQDLMRHAKETEKSFAEAVQDQRVISALSSDIDELTDHYQRGKELFLSQACYACHRIAGLSRGGIGPELTLIGQSYPWYIKESIVWPQADLPTSTMPNMRLDHLELQDLMTFLLAQKGSSRAVAKTAYQADLQAWEAGKKLPWEKPIPPSQMYDLRESMTIFATQGCASCHRLQGFDSNVGFKAEKESSPFGQFYEQQQWFKKLFPEVVHFTYYDEEMPGSEIVAAIEKNIREIDEKIVADARKNGILEEIDRNHPQVIESLYSPFRYAARAKDHEYRTLIEKEKNPEKIAAIQQQWNAWKDRVHRVLMMYIQVYGLGRLIGPHLNWSGIYRSDEWLMEHFRNPTGHVPRSIMPIFPFDDTKFYALTHMLDVLAVRNREALRHGWDEYGFNPEETYAMLCAQCHGIGLVGNGVIAEWIYPIPKNLHDAEFLRNLTKERVIYSISHGVKGTPMPPWAEFSSNKPMDVKKVSHETAVLNEDEIHYLVNWLFSSLPGGEIIRSEQDVPKWQYSPKDILEELRKEGGRLEPKKENEADLKGDLSTFFKQEMDHCYYASLDPQIYPKKFPQEAQEDREVEELFDIVPHATDGRANSYYIKQKFYTSYNIEQGKEFFLLNCAACHGNEADGTGARAQAMQSAKPRMLNNLDWIRSHDDLRLLRSIKYGVPGTAMTPWGDLTNALQRLQLVIFIRSLSEEQDLREELGQAIYQTFDNEQLLIEGARIDENQQMQQFQKQLKEVRMHLENVEHDIAEGKIAPQEAVEGYEKSLEIEKKMNSLQVQDQKLVSLKNSLKQERDLYMNLGVVLLSKNMDKAVFYSYLDMIRLNGQRYHLKDHQLTMHHSEQVDENIRKSRQAIVDQLDNRIAVLEQQRRAIEGKISSIQQREELSMNQAEIESFKKMKNKLIVDTEEAIRLANEQLKTQVSIRNGKNLLP